MSPSETDITISESARGGNRSIAADAVSRSSSLATAPNGDAFPPFPKSWYFFCASRDLDSGPVGRDLFGTRLVGWKTRAGTPVILTAACSHFGADLSQGRVHDDRLRCPFHHWEFAADGQCRHIPAEKDVPPTARQRAWPVVQRHGVVFVFNDSRPLFDLLS